MAGETRQRVDEILARVELLRHGSFSYVLESHVAVEIDHRRDDSLARQVDVHSPGRNLQLTSKVVMDQTFPCVEWNLPVYAPELLAQTRSKNVSGPL